MSEEKMMRLSQVVRKLNVGKNHVVEFLTAKGHSVDNSPNAKISQTQYDLLAREFAASASEKEEASHLTIGIKHEEIDPATVPISRATSEAVEEPEPQTTESVPVKEEKTEVTETEKQLDKKEEIKKEQTEESGKVKVKTETGRSGLKVVGKIDLEEKKKTVKEKEDTPKAETTTEPQAEPVEEKTAEPKEDKVIKAKADSLKGLNVVGKIDLPDPPKKSKPEPKKDQKEVRNKKRPRKRIQQSRIGQSNNDSNFKRGGQKRVPKEELTDKQIQEKISETLARLDNKTKSGGKSRSKYRKEKRSAVAEAAEEKMLQAQEESKILKVTEFISASNLASLMDISVNNVISSCMSLGMFISINQRLDAEAITIIADEFGFDVQFTTTDDEVDVALEEDKPEDLLERAPIVTIMGHVDHGKTSLLDYIRNANVTAGEAGGITQHIGAYDVHTKDKKRIAFLDTPGHEAFTAMRARGAKITDVAIIVIAADDSVMPQTKEAINHAQVAEVPIVIAINKIDKANANSEKIKEELSQMNILVEDWGGKYQCQEVSASTGQGIDELLEKVLLEAELLELKANPHKKASGTVIEATLDKGRGYLVTMMVQGGTLRVGDVALAGSHFGKVKAMFDHRGKRLKEVGPATPVQMLGLSGAPQAGDKFNVMGSDREAREIANKREQILREQSVRARKHITLDEIGRRLAVGNFKELNVIVKGDVDGSVEALSDSLLKLSTEEVQVNIIQKGVGQISESDVLLATASDAVIIGFQVRPSGGAKKLAENEEIEIRLYSVIYDAINELKDAMEGLLEPTEKEVITGNVEVRETFKISKIGTVAGCYVTDGFVKRNNQIRLIRDGIVTYTGDIGQLKRFKDDVNEVKAGYECGLSIKNFNDIKSGDVIEGFEIQEIKRTL